ncbi:MAG: PAS domain-containing sensor histidine kinase [Anaerolineae bacterium]|nr:PAS domain-containing sensor histidine kinase [Anaerolineae bacterium]
MNRVQGSSSREDRPIMSSTGLLVVMMMVLFVAMVISGILLNQQISTLEAESANLDWVASFVQTNRTLIMVLGVASFLLMLLLTFMLMNLRRTTETPQMVVEQVQNQLNTLLTNMYEGVIVSQDSHILFTNRALSRLTGYSPEELRTQRLHNSGSSTQFGEELARLHQTVSHAINQGGIWHGPFKLHAKDGSELDVVVTGTPVETSNGHTPHILTLVRDGSQEKRLQAQKTAFVSNTSHELRTPLATLKMHLHLLRKQPDKLEENLQIVENITNTLGQLVEEMVDIGRFERGAASLDLEPAEVQKLVKQAVKGYESKAERRGATLICEMPDQPIMATLDYKRILQVMTNLVSNAMNHIAQSGKVTVRVTLESTPQPGFVRIEVQDDGVGLSPDMLEQVFQPFARASQGLVSGTVLGLSITKEIIELHGGQITVESEVGKGTLFIVRLPLKQPGEPAVRS